MIQIGINTGAVGSNAKQQDEYLQPIPEPRHSIPSRPPLGPEYIYKPEGKYFFGLT